MTITQAKATGTGYTISGLNAKGEGLLTARENQAVNLVAEGFGNREIASQLGITENTVKKSLLRIYNKLGVSNRVDLVLYALTHRDTQAWPEIVAPRANQGESDRIQCGETPIT